MGDSCDDGRYIKFQDRLPFFLYSFNFEEFQVDHPSSHPILAQDKNTKLQRSNERWCPGTGIIFCLIQSTLTDNSSLINKSAKSGEFIHILRRARNIQIHGPLDNLIE